jgi:hypothetical protein
MSYDIKEKYMYKPLIIKKQFLKKVPKYLDMSERPPIFTM